MIEIFIIVLYSCWILVTILLRLGFSRLNNYKTLDIFRLVPGWRFFAPNPPRYDYHILYRDRVAAAVGEFQLFAFPVKKYIRAVFNPKGRLELAVFKTSEGIVKKIAVGNNDEKIKASYEYLNLLYIVMRDMPINAQRQFIILRSQGNSAEVNLTIILTSDFHGH